MWDGSDPYWGGYPAILSVFIMMVIYAKDGPAKLVKNNKHSLLNKKLQECIRKINIHVNKRIETEFWRDTS